MNVLKNHILENGMNLPLLGYGTAESKNSQETIVKIKAALNCGYRLFDTAKAYDNEESLGIALQEYLGENSSITRKDLIISSKVANEDQGYYSTLKAFEASINKLQLDYLDIYLIHWPIPKAHEKDYIDLNQETWQAMEELYFDQKVRAIGVCNFLARHIKQISDGAAIKPMINQIEIHPQYQEKELVDYCQRQGIVVEGWGPFRAGQIFDVVLLQQISQKYGKSVSQICIRWSLQSGIIPLPKASSVARMLENLDVFNFSIENEDMRLIDSLDSNDAHADYGNYKRQLEF
jgi:diketogulonate reductase-like aldo/keto reductase